MKKIFSIITILLSSLLFSQQVYSLNANGADAPNNSYFKDLNGELDLYVGLWKGNWMGKTLYIQFKKVKYFVGTNGEGIYQDRILGERKVIEANGIVSIDRIANFDNQKPQFKGINFKFSNPSQKQIYFVTGICGKTANLDVTFLDNAKTQMSLHLIYNPSTIDDTCPYYNSVIQGNDFPINFPKDIVLTKQ
ncbi:hypothetical protein SAMN05444360_12027 [Chryseobacterium carnipullorum]|uniref:DUF6705 family protein n=1 Tax=Chryseobacterium carnipullorum TaxID=1124835 RepID=UPI000917336B|nr:DUF6705 family protein [Chryseobacterium carnipullorum]SHM87546.1 hypothetical protein SAMN05444360_12027 [Chryseobacterium carnipullorum]